MGLTGPSPCALISDWDDSGGMFTSFADDAKIGGTISTFSDRIKIQEDDHSLSEKMCDGPSWVTNLPVLREDGMTASIEIQEKKKAGDFSNYKCSLR